VSRLDSYSHKPRLGRIRMEALMPRFLFFPQLFCKCNAAKMLLRGGAVNRSLLEDQLVPAPAPPYDFGLLTNHFRFLWNMKRKIYRLLP